MTRVLVRPAFAAATSLSDRLRNGRKALTALNIFCARRNRPHNENQILRGGCLKNDRGPVHVGRWPFGDRQRFELWLSVTGGEINPRRIFANRQRLSPANHILVLTKKMGTGIITNAAKFLSLPETYWLRILEPWYPQ